MGVVKKKKGQQKGKTRKLTVEYWRKGTTSALVGENLVLRGDGGKRQRERSITVLGVEGRVDIHESIYGRSRSQG